MNKVKINHLSGAVEAFSVKDTIDALVDGIPRTSKAMLEMVENLVKEAELDRQIRNETTKLIELGYTYNPVDKLESDLQFNNALECVRKFLKPNGLILLNFLINRSYFVGYNEGYDDNDE